MRILFASLAVAASASESGQFMYRKFSDANCTTPLETHHLVGPLNACIDNSKGLGFAGLSPASKLVKVNNTMTISFYTAGCTDSALAAIPMPVDTCTASSSGGYYIAYYSSSDFEGGHQYRKYTDSNCTTAMTSGDTGYAYWDGLINDCTDAAQYGHAGPAPFVNITGCGTGSVSSAWSMSCGGAATVIPYLEDSCGASSTGGYYKATCVTAAEVISHPPPDEGQFLYRKFSDANCTTPLETHHLAGPLNACIDNSKGLGFAGLSPASMLVKVGSTMTISFYTAGCDGAALAAIPMPVDTCTASSSGGYYIAYYSPRTFEGSHQYRKYTDASCTAPMNSSTSGYAYWDALISDCMDANQYGANGPAGFVNITGCGTGSVSSAWSTSCGGAATVIPYLEDSCGASSTGGYYKATCVTASEVLSVVTTTTTTTTTTAGASSSSSSLPQGDAGQFLYRKFSDANCTLAIETHHLAGPMNTCIDNAQGAGFAGLSPASRLVKVNNTMTISFYVAGCTGSALAAIPMPIDTCTASSSGGYYIAYYSSSTFEGSHQYRKYTDSSCTAPMNSSTSGYAFWDALINHCMDATQYGANGPAPFVNITGCGTGSVSSAWSASCGGAATVIPYLEDSCGASSTGGFYKSTCVTPTSVVSHVPTTTTAAVTATPNTTTTAAPSSNEQTEVVTAPPAKTISGSYAVVEDLPAGTTGAQLEASTPYKNAKKTGLANALSVSASTITVTGFVVSRRRALQAKKGRQLASINVETQYEVAVAASGGQSADDVAAALVTLIQDPATATAIQTQTNNAMSAADFSSDATFASYSPQLTAAPTVAAPTTAAVAGVSSSGPFQVQVFSDSACTVSTATVQGNLGDCVTGADGSTKWKVQTCTSTVLSYQQGPTACATSSGWTDAQQTLSSTCTASGASYVKTYCGTIPSAGGAAASDGVMRIAVVSPVVAALATVVSAML